ncbi:MAG: class I SAM-dependent methyltransferase [Deltaproteobacteria bacterium]|jgi:ABC-2 type transport system ATP-binding protein|nr:class I SAM-dependent methyltransferase [Deltaproteobacteria bacterium]
MIEKYWSRFPHNFDENQEYVVGKALLEDIIEELGDLPELGKLVEFGCGTGYFTETIIQKTHHLVATDLSDELLEMAKKRLDNNTAVIFQKENCMASSFASEKFDSVFMANLIHVVDNPVKVLLECYRILKNGGMLIIVTYTNYGMNLMEKIKLAIRFLKTWGKPPKHTHVFSPERLASLMQDAGFTIEKSKLIGNRTKALYLIGKKS